MRLYDSPKYRDHYSQEFYDEWCCLTYFYAYPGISIDSIKGIIKLNRDKFFFSVDSFITLQQFGLSCTTRSAVLGSMHIGSVCRDFQITNGVSRELFILTRKRTLSLPLPKNKRNERFRKKISSPNYANKARPLIDKDLSFRY